MNGSAAATPTTRALQWARAHEATGRFVVGTGTAALLLHVLDGRIVGARAGDETRRVIERLARRHAITSQRASQLHAMIDQAAKTASDPLRVGADPIIALLADEVDAGAFDIVVNERYHENLCRFVGTEQTPSFDDGATPWLDHLVLGAPADQLERSVLAWDKARALDERRPLVAGPRKPETHEEQLVRQALGDHRGTVSDIVSGLDLEPVAAKIAVLIMLDRGVLADPPSSAMRASAGGWERRPATPAPIVDTSVHTTADDELDAFAGEMDLRRGPSRGSSAFATSQDQLDRVELDAPSPKQGDPGFAAPVLSERDAKAKIDVANDVLINLCRAIDADGGAGRGAAMLQLLVDARPRHFAAVLDGAKLNELGLLPADVLLTNVRRRAAAEQRRLLHDCLIDLLDRAVDKTGDELHDESYDRVLERVVGYRQRMGL